MQITSKFNRLVQNYSVSKALRARREMMIAGPVHQIFRMKDADVQRANLSMARPDAPNMRVVRSIIQRSLFSRPHGTMCSFEWFSSGLSESGLLGMYYSEGHQANAENLTGLLEYELDTGISYDTHTYFDKDEERVKEYLKLRSRPFNGATVLATEAFLWKNRFLFLGADSSGVVAPSFAAMTTGPASFSIPTALRTSDQQFLRSDKGHEKDVEKAGAVVQQFISDSIRRGMMDEALGSSGTGFVKGIWFYSTTLLGWVMDPSNFTFSLDFRKYGPTENVRRFYHYQDGQTGLITNETDLEMIKGNTSCAVFYSRPSFFARIGRTGIIDFTLTNS